ncbi:uncharacterized protein RJT21DRAFT_120577 [Scheffersomyces amazonensis]|uniref:uncharacterized protein n=1 Tax=Scheffersomyces amazonensis TaxID=1078765 RepID=UPI00315CE230
MLIESSVNEKYLRTLTIGSFPRQVLSFQESQDFFQQLVFIDYQLQLLIQNEFGRNEFKTAKQVEYQGNKTVRGKLVQLIDYVHSITLNYGNATNSYEEKLYYSVLMAHLYYLNSQISEMNQILNSVSLTPQFNYNSNLSLHHNEFLQYLSCRYYVLSGLIDAESSYKIWLEFLVKLSVPFTKSNVLANYWLDLMSTKLVIKLTQNGLEPLSFTKDIKQLPFYSNSLSTIRFSQLLLRPENSKFINDTFKSGYTQYLLEQLEEKVHNKSPFPEASNSNKSLEIYIGNLYDSLSNIPQTQTILKSSLSKKFLVNSTSKTYQSQTVLANLIKTLIDLNEYDEAFAAFRTYISYLEADQEHHEGHINNILLIIDIYSKCILNFNPLTSIITPSKVKKFKYTTEDRILDSLAKHVKTLLKYLNELTSYCDLTYDNETDTETNPLSFLYRKYNVNLLLSDSTQLVELVSRAWYSIGHYYYYLSIYGSSTESILQSNITNLLKYYKNALIINSTGNGHYLFDYALALSNNNQLQPALKLCKFILKKFPESFKTWNLLILLQSAFEANSPDSNKEAIPARNFSDTEDTEDESQAFRFNNNPKSTTVIEEEDDQQLDKDRKKELEIQEKLSESEKFANNALNIAGLVILRHQQKNLQLTIEAKYEILQLKLTQLAVWESIHGVQYILDYLPEVFITYHELFDNVEIEPTPIPTSNTLREEKLLTTTSKWSHRPSVIDPTPAITPNSLSTVVSNGTGGPTSSGATSSTVVSHLNTTLITNNKEKLSSGVDKIKRISLLNKKENSHNHNHITHPGALRKNSLSKDIDNVTERKILQDMWLWTAKIFLKIGLLTEAEQCIVEAETIYEPNYKTFSCLGHLTCRSRKFLSLQEYERSLEILTTKFGYNRIDYGETLLGLCKLFIMDDKPSNSLFISTKDADAGLIRIKNLLEKYTLSWPYGHSNVEVWYYLSKIYESIDDRVLLRKSLWTCIELEDYRPVRSFNICDSYKY